MVLLSTLMAAHSRAAKALLFMQQCRQRATRQSSFKQRSLHDPGSADQFDPTNYGKKIRLSDTTSEPVPAWRLPKTDSPVVQNVRDQVKSFDIQRARNYPVPRYRHNPARSTGWLGFIKHTILRLPEPAIPARQEPFSIRNNPYKAKKQWPPNLGEMSELQQFHYEKTFRRRLLNKTRSLRYNWDRWALFFRRFLVGLMIFYFALVAEPPNPNTRVPPDGLRYWLYGKLRQAEFWPSNVHAWVEDKYQFYRKKHKRQWDPYNHEGWDESRPRNSLPGKVAPPVNKPLEE